MGEKPNRVLEVDKVIANNEHFHAKLVRIQYFSEYDYQTTGEGVYDLHNN